MFISYNHLIQSFLIILIQQSLTNTHHQQQSHQHTKPNSQTIIFRIQSQTPTLTQPISTHTHKYKIHKSQTHYSQIPSNLKYQLYFKLCRNNINKQMADHQEVREDRPQNVARSSISIHKALTGLFMALGIKTERTVHCKHNEGCIQSTLISFIRSFLLGYSIKSAISIVLSLKSIFKNPAKLIQILKSGDSISFGMFMGCFSGMFKAVICIARRFLGQTKVASIVAGFLAGSISSLFLRQSTRQTLALFLLTRALDTIYNSLIQKGIIPKWKYDYVLLYSLMMSVTGYCYGNQPGCLSPDMNKFYLKFTNESLSDLQMRQVWIQRKNRSLAEKGIAPHNPLDYMPPLKKYYQSIGK